MVDFLVICLGTFFGVRNMRNTSAMRVISFLKCSQFNLHFKNVEKNSENVSVPEIVSSELAVLNCLY